MVFNSRLGQYPEASCAEKNSAVCNFSKARRLEPINIECPLFGILRGTVNMPRNSLGGFPILRGIMRCRRLALENLQKVKLSYAGPCILQRLVIL